VHVYWCGTELVVCMCTELVVCMCTGVVLS
jgi:hypothetical protein